MGSLAALLSEAAAQEITRGHIDTASGMKFESLSCNEHADAKGRVLLLHGFPFFMDMWRPLMEIGCQQGWHMVAYNQRGYSPNAPQTEDMYHYDILREDVFQTADALEWDTFNLVGHDHGAVLGYYVVDSESGHQRVLSYSALAIPHPKTLNQANAGPNNIAPSQETATQYFNYFIEENSAQKLYGVGPFGKGFDSADDFQKALWWYNGAVAAGVISIPRLYSLEDSVSPLRNLFRDLAPNGRPSIPATYEWGNVEMPFLYAIGSKDDAILGFEPWALKTKENAASTYTELIIEAVHDLCTPGPENPETETLFYAIIGRLRTERLEGDHRTMTMKEPVVRELPAYVSPPPLFSNPVFWVVMGVIGGAVAVGAYVSRTGSGEELVDPIEMSS